MQKLKMLFDKYKALISYAFFGGCTTIVNWATYILCYNKAHIPNVISTIIAWIVAVAFAFITNKLWVFNSKSFNWRILLYEIWTFISARLLTGLLEVGIMYFAVDMYHLNASLWKLLSNIVVIILNYVFSKLIIFKSNNDITNVEYDGN